MHESTRKNLKRKAWLLFLASIILAVVGVPVCYLGLAFGLGGRAWGQIPFVVGEISFLFVAPTALVLAILLGLVAQFKK